jgi:uncharacterized protein (UPF0216 family)
MAGQKGNTNKPIDKEALTETISLRFSKSELEEIEKIAEEIDIPKTRLIRNLVLSSLDEAKIFNKIGVLKGVKKLIDFKERFLNTQKYQTLPTE